MSVVVIGGLVTANGIRYKILSSGKGLVSMRDVKDTGGVTICRESDIGKVFKYTDEIKIPKESLFD